MKLALIFLNGYYDLRYPEFYKKEIEWGLENNYSLICADGGIRLFHELNQSFGGRYSPNILIGDLDSCTRYADKFAESTMQVVSEWVGMIDKDYTDGQLAVIHAVKECNVSGIIIYGGLPRPDGYETDHFLGNLKLMRFGDRVSQTHANVTNKKAHLWNAEMRDAFQAIYFVTSELRMNRRNAGLQRVSLLAEHANVLVEDSKNLRWSVAGLRIDPDLGNALRNEFLPNADSATIRLTPDSDALYVIHNWQVM
jgi:thiamine pyrophosphokinase